MSNTLFTYNSTFSTPSLSVEIQVIVTESDTVKPSSGEIIKTVGGIVSGSDSFSQLQNSDNKKYVIYLTIYESRHHISNKKHPSGYETDLSTDR